MLLKQVYSNKGSCDLVVEGYGITYIKIDPTFKNFMIANKLEFFYL
jgi:hypothetical protein